MRIVVLIEDSAGGRDVASEHGLSLYTETEKSRILMDTGASDKTLENARRLGVDPSDIDKIVISHGHYDHTGGLLAFSKAAERAEVFMRKSALGDFYHGERYIGADKKIAYLENLRLIEDAGAVVIGEGVSLFSVITGGEIVPSGTLALSERKDGKNLPDDFSHEQCLVIEEGEKKILFSGCAHNGILNILNSFKELYSTCPDFVFSGFHMMKKTEYTEEEVRRIRLTAEKLSSLPTVFYTGHCTGDAAFDIMKEIMAEKLVKIHSGDEIVV